MSPLLLLLGLAGGIYFLSRRGSSGDISAPITPSANPNAPQWGVIPDDILAKYQSIIYGHGTQNDCKDVLEFIDHLDPESDADEVWLANVRRDVVTACEFGAIDVSSPGIAQAPPLPLDFNLPQSIYDAYNRCVSGGCTTDQAASLADTLYAYARQWQGLFDTTPLTTAASFVDRRYGTAGVHVGDCGCAECAERREAEVGEACCAECAERGVGACSCQMPRFLPDEEPLVSGA